MSQALARKPDAPALVEGEFAFTANDFAQIAQLLYEQAGITLSDSKSTLVYSRLAKRLRALGLASFAEYIALVSSPAGDTERGAMLNALTTNVTRFFREPHHFDHLRDQVLAPRIAAVKAGRARMRLWSAGCSTGQEPYSIAMTVLSLLPDAPNLDVKILATDIDTKVLATGREAIYSEELISAIPPEARNRWLEKDRASGDWRMSAAVRSLVSFKELNLIGQWPVKGPFDAIFCRNVVIYFDEPTQERIWSRFAPLLGTEGRMYIGHSERVAGAAGQWISDGLTVYRHQAGGAR
ncbi:CheR family methyltransferase [Caulobacter sp. KR2-114]|uniref:CheR family methyltransferase n=1 Tax=Caulobacter sp. KR2-114 TaxID=3400912 RepID=UPI003C0F3EBF